MLHRAIIYNIDKQITILWLKDVGNWFDFENRSYRIDRKAVCQLKEKDGSLRGITESIYIEGKPTPIRSTMTDEDVTKQLYQEKLSQAANKPQTSFWAKLFGRK